MALVSSLSKQHLATLSSADWFADLPVAVQKRLTDHAHRRRLPNGKRVFSRGDTPDGAYVVLEGALRMSGVSKEGRETVLDFYPPGNLVGEVSMFAGVPRSHDAVAHGPTLVLFLGLDDIERLMSEHPLLSRALLRLEAQRLSLLLTSLEQYSVQTLEQRLANRLLLLAKSFGVPGRRGVDLDLQLSQETLARLIGATRQRVNQILHKWADANIVEHEYGRILLRNTGRLKEFARL